MADRPDGMRVAVVGPTHPFKGGVAQHTTVLAQQLRAAGHDVQLISWLRQYPARLYPGQQTVASPELPPFSPTERVLSWNQPESWVRAARRLRDADLVVFAHVTPVQAVPYRVMLGVLRRLGVRTAVVCHNVLPHEPGRLDVPLVRSLLSHSDLVVVHSEQQRRVAAALTIAPIRVARLAPHLPASPAPDLVPAGEHRRLLFFGLVRPYKGLDVLIEALAKASTDVALLVAGEFWEGIDAYRAQLTRLRMADRVELRPGYVATAEVPALFADVDALVLPYRSATGSQAVWSAFEFGVPVIATRAGHLADDVRDGVDGLLAEPGSVESLTDAIRRFYQPGVPQRIREAVRPVDPAPYWARYLEVLTNLPGSATSTMLSQDHRDEGSGT